MLFNRVSAILGLDIKLLLTTVVLSGQDIGTNQRT